MKHWTEEDVARVSARNNKFGGFQVAHALEYAADTRQKQRRERGECRYCFYFRSGGLAGQAFTGWTCFVCRKEQMHPNTACPRVCTDCAKTHQLCPQCGGDTEMRVKRKASIPEERP